MVAVQAPQVAGVLAGPAQRRVQAKVCLVDFRGLFHPALLEQQCAVGVPGGLHPPPRLVVGQCVVEFDGSPQVREGLLEKPFPIGDFTVEHGGGHREDVAGGVVEQVPRLGNAGVCRTERLALRPRLRQLSFRGMRDTLAIVQGGRRGAVQRRVVRQRLGDQVVPASEPHQDVHAQWDERLEPVRHRGRGHRQRLGSQLCGQLVGGLQSDAGLAAEHRRVDDEMQVVGSVERIEVQRALTFDEPAVGLDGGQVGGHRAVVVAAQHVDVGRHVLQVTGVGHESA